MNWGGVLLSRVRIARHRMFGQGRGAARVAPSARPLLAGVLGLVLAGVVTLALMVVFLQLRDDGADARQAAVALGLLLTTTLVGLVAFDLQEVVSTLVVDSDLELLRRAPVSPGALFVLKLADAFPRTSALLVVLALPALMAFAVVFPIAPWGWMLAAPAVVALWAFALGAGTAAAVLLLRFVPARTAREVLGLLSTVAIFVLWLANSFLLPRAALESSSPRALLEALRARSSFAYAVSPGTWVAELMAAASDGAAGEALRSLGITLLAAAAALFAAQLTAVHSLDLVQARVFGGAASRARRAAPAMHFAAHPRLLSSILTRDLRLFVRDWTVLGDILVASVLWTLLPVVTAPLIDVDRTLLARAMLLSLTVALGSEIAARAIPLERRGIAWMRLAPVPAWRWLANRVASTLVIALPIVIAAAWGVLLGLRIDPSAYAGTLSVVLPALVMALAIGVWTGAVHGNFEWTHPRAMLTLTGRTIGTLALLAQAVIWLGTAWIMERFELGPAVVLPGLAAIAISIVLLLLAGRHLERRSW